MSDIDSYIQDVIKQGDEGSALLAALCAPTLKNSKLVDIIQEGMNGLAVLRIPENHLCIVHSKAANSTKRSLQGYAGSLVDNLVEAAWQIGATPIGFADVVDASAGKRDDIDAIGRAIVARANHYELPILNGELAILGNRVTKAANVSGTMISIVSKDYAQFTVPGVFSVDGTTYAVFDPKGKAVWINSDGIGTKTEFYERLGTWEKGLWDSLAMKLDDTIKLGATAQVVSDVVETRFGVPFELLVQEARIASHKIGCPYILQWEECSGDRIMGYKRTSAAYNVSGSAVSTIDEERLKNPLKPGEGEYLIAIRGPTNPRSNGITDKRKIATRMFGQDWHMTEEGILLSGYLAQPSVVFYPLFKELIDQGIATSVYHMSGGAYNGKLARPLAKHGLYAELNNLYMPDYRELSVMGAMGASMETAYGKWPMGNDGFITVKESDIKQAQKMIEMQGLESRVVSRIERRADNITGVKITAPSNGETIYYSGKD
jgi:phosphoribosylaminoimidazole (AIR) synthetase